MNEKQTTSDATETVARDTVATAILREQDWYDGEPGETLEPVSWDECRYEAGASEWLTLTDSEADGYTADEIERLLWAFNADFLESYMPEGITADEITAIRGDRCEDANDAMLALVNAGPYSLAELVTEAVQADGRGHFLAGYDGEEIEYRDETGAYWYGYRVS